MRVLKHCMIPVVVVMILISSVTIVRATSQLAENFTAQVCHEILQKNPKTVVIDARTQPEFQFQGYLKGAYSIPYWFFGKKFAVKDQEYEYASGVMKKAAMNRYQFTSNSEFMKYVKTIAKPNDTILIYCSSGVRSALAADDLVNAGYKHVINMLDGIEGKNGWKESKLPLEFMMEIKNLSAKYVYPPDVL